MKKNLLLVALLLLVSISLFAAGKTETEKVEGNLPEFVLNPPKAENAIYGVGYAKLARVDQSLTTAKARARADIARQIGVQVESVLTDYFQQSGTVESSQAIEFAEGITREIVNRKLGATVNEKTEQDKDGGIWVLVSFSKDDALNAFEEVANSFVRSEEAAYSEFKAREATAMLEQTLNSSPTTSEPVKE